MAQVVRAFLLRLVLPKVALLFRIACSFALPALSHRQPRSLAP